LSSYRRALDWKVWETPKEVINVQINRDCQNSKVLMQCKVSWKGVEEAVEDVDPSLVQ